MAEAVRARGPAAHQVHVDLDVTEQRMLAKTA